MSVNGDVSEQVVRLSLDGFEVLARLTGSGAKNVAAMIYTMLKDTNQTKGKIKLNNMLKTGKNLKIFTIKQEDLKTFSKESKKYGISYCALIDKKQQELDGMVDIMVKEDDAPRINRIVERFKLITIDTAKIETEAVKLVQNKELLKKEKGYIEKTKEEQLQEVLSQKPVKKEQPVLSNFNMAKAEKSPLLEPSSIMQEGVSNRIKKPSVKKELAVLKVEAQKLEKAKLVARNSNIKSTKIPKKNSKKQKIK